MEGFEVQFSKVKSNADNLIKNLVNVYKQSKLDLTEEEAKTVTTKLLAFIAYYFYLYPEQVVTLNYMALGRSKYNKIEMKSTINPDELFKYWLCGGRENELARKLLNKAVTEMNEKLIENQAEEEEQQDSLIEKASELRITKKNEKK